MSFILQNKKLMEELVRLAQQQTPATLKPGQPQTPAAPAEPDPAKVKELALKLLGNLESQINSTTQFTSDKANTSLRMNNLQDLAHLLEFLNYNMIKFNGTPIALRHDRKSQGIASGIGDATYAGLGKDVQAQYVKYPEPETDEGNDFAFWINKPGIIAYVQDLQKEATDTKNNLMQAIVGRLSQEINEKVGIAVPAAGSNKPKLDPAAPLDSLLDTFIIQAPYEMGTNTLLQRDLASKQSLWGFLSAHNMSLKNGNDIKQLKDFDGSDMCSVVQVLYARAKRYVDTRGAEADDVYLQLVVNLASSMNCPIGVAPGAGAQNAGYQQVGYVTQQGAFTQQGIAAMANVELPLVRGQIVFDRIRRYAETFKKVYPQSEYADDVLASLNEINIYRLAVLPLRTDSYQKIDSQIRANTNNSRSAADYFKRVEVMLSNTKQMLMQVQEMYRRYGTGNPGDANTNGIEGMKQELDDQVRNIYMDNSGGLDILENQVQQGMRDIANQVKGKQTW